MIRVYRALLLAQLQLASQYRVQMFLWVLFSIIRPVIFLAAWTAVAQAQGGSVGGFTAGDFAAYYVGLTLVTHLAMAWNAYEFELEVRQGKLSPKLLRPLHPIHYSVAENVVWKVFTLVAVVPALFVIGWTFGARFQTDAAHLLLFVPSVLLGAALYFVFGWLLATVAFWTTRVSAVSTLYDRAVFIFAGQIAPLALLPGALQTVAYALPFGYMLGVPADILRGAPSVDQALLLVGVQAAWLVAGYAALQVVWRAGLKQYSAVGA
ncbi:MAG: ABC transporter permease [Candidatus Limnocylindria bacterium]